jgi:transcriptional regulator with GAF, ATPase, and Fis domain
MKKERMTALGSGLEELTRSECTTAGKRKRLLELLQVVAEAHLVTLHPQRDREESMDEAYLYADATGAACYLEGKAMLSMLSSDPVEFRRFNRGTLLQGRLPYGDSAFSRLKLDHPWIRRLSDHFQLASALLLTLEIATGKNYVLAFYSRFSGRYTDLDVDAFEPFLGLIIKAVASAGDSKELSTQPKHSSPKRAHTETELRQEIVGSGAAVQQIVEQLKILAPSDTTVLIYGETGTGKERIARGIHQMSIRCDRPLVTVNCAALPANLIESELFGYEKGAFTGAIERRIGKFEQAKGGTIFLDEIGELPCELQVKLLRVLQEKEIERLGGHQTIPLDVRIVAATNRQLGQEVEKGIFRRDLFYRLNTFPITVPALRDRKEDIPELAAHFIRRYSSELGKPTRSLSVHALEQLSNYDWPGNVRELEHLIERAVLLSKQVEIGRVDLPEVGRARAERKQERALWMTMEEMERDYILEVLQKCKGKIAGQNNAAEILGMPISTLYSRMLKLGIRKKEQKAQTQGWTNRSYEYASA